MKRTTELDPSWPGSAGAGGNNGRQYRHGALLQRTAAILDADAADGVLCEWRELAERAIEPNPFFRPAFLLPAIAALAPGAVKLLTIRDSQGLLVGLAPVMYRRTGFGLIGKYWSLWRHGFGPLSTPLVDANGLDQTLGAMIDALGGGPAVAFPNQNLDGPVAEALVRICALRKNAPAIVGPYHRALLDSPLSGVDYQLAVLSSRRRRKLRQYEKSLAKRGEISFTVSDGAEAADAAFPEFCAIEASGWKGRKGTAMLSREAILCFTGQAVSQLGAGGNLRIFALRIDGEAIAMAVTFVDGSDAFVWKIAFDETFAIHSPGVVMMQNITNHLLNDPSVARVDSLADPGHPLIDHLWAERRQIGIILVPGRHPWLRFRLAEADIKLHLIARETAIRALRAVKRRLKHN